MTRTRSSAMTLAAIVVAAVAVTAPSTATAQGEKDAAFKAGLDARKEKQWSKVVTEMRRAIDEDGKESTRKVGRVIFGGTEYLPYYFLGEAYLKQNDCANAVVAWENSLKQRVVHTKGEYFGELQKGNAVCEEKGVLLAEKFEAAVTRARAQLQNANAAMTGVKDKGSAHLGVWQSNAAFDTEYQRASSTYDAARKHLNEAQRSRLQSDFSEVTKSTDSVKAIVESIESELTAALKRGTEINGAAAIVRRSIEDARGIDAQIEAKRNYLTPASIATRADALKLLENAAQALAPSRLSENAIAAARSSVAEGVGLLQKVLESVDAGYVKDNKLKIDRATGLATAAFSRAEAELAMLHSLMEGNPAKVTPQLQVAAEALGKQLESARRRRDGAVRGQQLPGIEGSTRQADAVHSGLLALEQEIGVEPTLEERGVPPWLQQGAKSFLDGDYAGALSKLVGEAADESAQWHAHLFRAAAEHALYVRSGEKDMARRDKAIAEIKRCKTLKATFAPDTRAFSPKFIEFYQRDGAPPQSASRAQ